MMTIADDDDLYDYERLDHSPSPAKEENISVSVNPEAAEVIWKRKKGEEKEETAKAAEPEKQLPSGRYHQSPV